MAVDAPPPPPTLAELLSALSTATAPVAARLSAAAADVTAAASTATTTARAELSPRVAAAATAVLARLPPPVAAHLTAATAAATAAVSRGLTTGPPPAAARALDTLAMPLSAGFAASPAIVSAAANGGVDVTDLAFARAVLAIAAAPLIWNVVARAEYATGVLSKVFGRRGGCYVLAVWIFCFSLYRDALVVSAMRAGAAWGAVSGGWLDTIVTAARGWEGVLGGLGGLLVGSSMWRLGITGTYLGDYFGILMPARVTGFPFSWTSAPMYDGSTLLFVAKAIAEGSPVGLLLAAWVYVVYALARAAEDPFTAHIYARAEAEAAARAAPAKKRQ